MLDDPPRQSPQAQGGRAEGRRAPGFQRLDGVDHDGAVFRRAAARGPGRRQTPCRRRCSTPSSILWASRAGENLERFRGFERRAVLSRAAPRTSTMSTSRPARSVSASRSPRSPRWSRIICAPNPGGRSRQAGRMIALAGDAELDEGNIYECLQEGWKHDLRNTWWIIDYNRQSLDGIVREGLHDRIAAIFGSFGWDVVSVKYGKSAARRLRRSRAAKLCARGSIAAPTRCIRRWSFRAAPPGASGCSTTSATRARSSH